MKPFEPPNNEIVFDARQSTLKRKDELKNGFPTASSYEGVIDNNVHDIFSD